MGLREVSSILWRERHLLELLLFKLEEEQLLLAAGRTRWLSHATREVEMVLDEIKQTELARSVEVDAVAATLGLGSDPSLRELAETAPAPFGDLFEEHRVAFLTVTDEITALAEANRQLLARGYQAAKEVLATMGETRVEVYGPGGVTSVTPRQPLLIDRAL
jgi:hypothetical protein